MIPDRVPTSDPGYRVLVVEDESLLAELLAESLRDHGFEVRTVANAAEALRHLVSGYPCDVLFTDIDLRDRVDGALLSKLARELRPKLPVVYASGAVASLDQVAAVPGASFIPKPYNPDVVCDTLAKVAATRH
jgi:DNA-binding NtrC family response regulator